MNEDKDVRAFLASVSLDLDEKVKELLQKANSELNPRIAIYTATEAAAVGEVSRIFADNFLKYFPIQYGETKT